MKILVLMKRVMDCSRQLSIDEREGRVRVEGSRFPMMDNLADLAALELAASIKKSAPNSSVTALSLGGSDATDILVNALILGADRAVRVYPAEGSQDPDDLYLVASALAEVIKGEHPDLVLCGTKSSDTGSSQLGGLISQLLNLPHISNVIKVQFFAVEGFLRVQRKLEKGRKLVLKCPLPALIAVEPSVAEPRYVTLFRQMKINRALIEQIPLDSVLLPLAQSAIMEVIKVARTKPRAKKSAISAASLSPMERMKLMAGQQNSDRGKVIDGDKEFLAGEIINYLQQKKIIAILENS